jgi:cytidylate kinase
VSAVVAIDGPAGSGKSTTARAVAGRLGFTHLDSGALYRAFALAALERELDEGERIAALADALPIRLDLVDDRFRPEIAGVDVSQAVRRPDVTARVSFVAALPAVRAAVNRMLRAAATLAPLGVVADGRDIGSVVFPDADLKIFLVAAAPERARRRLSQEGRAVDEASIRRASRELLARDARDAERAHAPLVQPPGAVRLDTTGMVFAEQVETIVGLARNAFPQLT